MEFCAPNDIVLPGQIVKDDDVENASNVKKMVLGPGLKRLGENVVVSKAGILKKQNLKIWVDSHQRRYIPVKGEKVVGIVVKKIGDIFKVDIGAPDQASLSYLAFENATKKNRPIVNPGDIIYGMLVTASPDMEPELVCVNSVGKSTGMGVQSGDDALLITCSLHLIRKLLNVNCKLLETLGKSYRYESCIGLNGRIWIKGHNIDTTLTIANAILSAENFDFKEIQDYCDQLCASRKKK